MKTIITILMLATVGLFAQDEKLVRAFNTVPSLLFRDPNVVDSLAAVEGLLASGDGGGGMLRYYPTSSTATNTSTVFKPNDFGGRWKMVFGGPGTTGTGSGIWTALTNIVQLATNGYTGYSFGDVVMNDLSTSNSFDIFGIGQTITGVKATNTLDVFLIGANITALTVNDSSEVYGIGSQALISAAISTSDRIFGIGDLPFQGATVTGSTKLFALGDSPLHGATVTGSSNVWVLGSGLQSAGLTASSGVVAIGKNAGNSITGTFTDVVLVGDASTATTGDSHRFILGPTMSLSTGDPGGGISKVKIGNVVTGATVALTTTNYWEVNINGVLKKVALVQ